MAVDPSPSAEALALLDTAACGLLQTHDDGRFIRVNRTFCDWVGHGADDLVGHRRFQDLLTIGGRIFHQTHWTPLLRMQGSVSEVKLELLHRDGTKIPMVVNAIRREEHGVLVHEIAAYVAHDRDKYERELVQSRKHLEVLLVERQRAEAELRLLNRQLDEASRAKDAFLATMSHEIRTPMNAVIGMTGLLRDTQLTDEQREFVETVRASGEHLLMLINDILDFSKIEAGKLEIEEAVFDLRSCVEEALDLIAAKAAEKRLELVFQAAPDLPGAVLGDAGRVRQVLLNLLSNAVKFTDRGEVVIELAAHRQADGRLLVEVAVRDTGIGIPEDKVGRLFQSFSQVDATNTQRRGGTGLGLVISRRLAEYMGGTITVETQAGIGSVFRFTFTVPEAEVSPPARPVKLSGVRVLAIDDNATNLRILRAQLEALEMSVRTTMSPREALAWVAVGERFDVAVLDMQMPETDGLALAQELRRLPGGAALPMILLSSLGAVRAEAEARGVELVAMLTKPVKQVQLLEALAAASLRGPAGATPVPHILAGSEADGLARVAPLRILVADDNTFNQRVAALTLTKLGQSCDMVANGHEAVQAVKDRGYDVVFMDVLMPELDGLEATRQIRTTLPSDRQPRIIAMTANALKGDR